MPTNYPYNLDTDINLPNIADVASPTTLASDISNTSNVITVMSTAGYPAENGLVVIDNEQITYSLATPTQFTGCVRGMFGTLNTSHASGAVVNSRVTASAYTNLRDAILQIQDLLGANGNNIAVLDKSSTFNAQQSSSGWSFTTPANGGTDNWQVVPTNVNGEAILNFIYSGNSSSNIVNMNGNYIQPPGVYNNPFATDMVFDFKKGNSHKVTLTGNVTTSSVINMPTGDSVILQIVQDDVGSRDFEFGPQFKGASSQMIDKSPGTTTILPFYNDGTNLYLYNVSV